ncbi:MAG: 2-hydroxyacyl-CoA dehydratase family protein [Lachnospiraceae bacterium]|nr:2-hydroxyacyl-CoA dehydratase family protein [Lachnospiraceae bacterium]
MTDVRDLPQNFEEYQEARKSGFMRVKEYCENGGHLVGYLCAYTPLEIIEAGGISAVGLCGTSNETVADAEQVLPQNLCPLIKSTFGFAYSDKCPYTYFAEMIIGETTCDGKKKMFELLNDIKETHVLQLPQSQKRSYAGDIWYEECKLLKEKLEEKFHVEITDEKLREAVKMRNKIREVELELANLQQAVPPVMKSTQAAMAMQQSTFVFSPSEQLANLRKLVDDAKDNYYNKGERPVSEKAKRILMTGCPSFGVLNKVSKTIEENGGTIVCPDDCSGERTRAMMIDENAPDILRAISDRYLQISCSVMSDNDARLTHLEEMVEKYKVEGVVDVVLHACHTFNIEGERVRRKCAELGIPYMKLVTDYAPSDSGQIATRISAFIEML